MRGPNEQELINRFIRDRSDENVEALVAYYVSIGTHTITANYVWDRCWHKILRDVYQGFERDDLANELVVKMPGIIRRYNGSKDATMSTWLIKKLRYVGFDIVNDSCYDDGRIPVCSANFVAFEGCEYSGGAELVIGSDAWLTRAAAVLLPEPHRTVINELFYQGGTCRDVASLMGISERWLYVLRKEALYAIECYVRDADGNMEESIERHRAKERSEHPKHTTQEQATRDLQCRTDQQADTQPHRQDT